MIGLSGTSKTNVSLTKTAAMLTFLEKELIKFIRKKKNEPTFHLDHVNEGIYRDNVDGLYNNCLFFLRICYS